MNQTQQKYAIRFGLGAIKAVGLKMMEDAVINRQKNGEFKDIYDFAERLDAKSINKKSIEALSKAGAFDELDNNRKKIAESFDVLSNYANQKKEQNSSNQMSLFGASSGINDKPDLKKTHDWSKVEKLQGEFEAFGFFLNEHPIDDYLDNLKKRGVIFSTKIEDENLEDNSLVNIAGVVCSSKHRSGSRGRFAYLTISDPYGIFEAMIFDEALINSARDILADGTLVVLECLVKKDDGGTRILTRNVTKLEEFIKNNKAKDKEFEDIKKQLTRRKNKEVTFLKEEKENIYDEISRNNTELPAKNVIENIEIIIKDRAPILSLKSFLSQKFAFDESKNSRVIISILNQGKFSKIELGKRYLLDQSDVNKIKNITSIIDVEIS